jgi:alkanesulfonate monooxygenase SsuD/methylene tetrahydromethanopterin reductase-like flavin-dependent oxidoreductase (luciferase family)
MRNSPQTSGTLLLGVSIDGAGGHPAAWREPDVDPRRLLDGRGLVELVQQAERGALDFVVIEDALGAPVGGTLPARLDAAVAAAFVGPGTRSIGIVPTITTTHTEPFHVSTVLATLDHLDHGRAGWLVAVSASDDDAALVGRRAAAPLPELYAEAAEAAEVAAELWDSWEDDAEIRDVATGRFIDRDKLHHIDHRGPAFTVMGPAITPRPPQGHPVVVVVADSVDALGLAAQRADVVVVDAEDCEEALNEREVVRAAVEAAGRDPGSVRVLARLDVLLGATPKEAAGRRSRLDGRWFGHGERAWKGHAWSCDELVERLVGWHRAGAVDGFLLRPAVLPGDLGAIVDHVVPALRAQGLRPDDYVGTTLRHHLGLARPGNRYRVPA